MKQIKEKLKSIRVKLFLTLVIVVAIIIMMLIVINNFVLETFYLYSKQKNLINTYIAINNYYNNPDSNLNLERELEKIAFQNNFDILIKTDKNINIYSSNKDFLSTINTINSMVKKFNKEDESVVYQDENIVMSKTEDTKNGLTFILLNADLDNGYQLYIRLPMASIQESVKISNKFLYLIGGFTILIGGIVVSFISRRFTKPILELNQIAKSMSKLDFSKKYRINDTDDEVNNLGKSINTMSDKLETTINQLRKTNIELEKDIEEKSKIDEMRKQFISDVSHELKTPIALIQGYAEGLIENVNSDEESRKFYAEVILDESNKMDRLVKQLLELMKLEYGKREFKNKEFNMEELEKEVVRKYQVMLEEKNIKLEMDTNTTIPVIADEFYIEQVLTNYITNAIKNIAEVNKEKIIRIENEIKVEKNKVRIKVFNTGENILEEDLSRIWNRFYKVDTSRNREAGGSGIGLSLVKAIMNNYNNAYGVVNKENGVEFYFELDLQI